MKKILFLLLFVFGWLLLLEACTGIHSCGGGPSACFNLNSVGVIAYDQQTGEKIEDGGPVESSSLLISIIPDGTRATCMVSKHSGVLMACSPPSPYFKIEVKEVSVTSSADLSASYTAGEELSPIMETFYVYEIIEGQPITSFDNAMPQDLSNYIYSINANWPYGTFFDVLRFKEGVEVAAGMHTLTIKLTLEDDAILMTSTTVEIM